MTKISESEIIISLSPRGFSRLNYIFNRWLRAIKTYRFPWYLTVVSANHASSNPGQVMADLQRNRFEPELVPNAEDSESENDRLEGTFWYTCERCKTMPTQRECVCCREQPESENKMEGIILSLYCIGRSKWKNNFLCKLP